MYGTIRKRKRFDKRFLPEFDWFNGIMLKDLKGTPPAATSTAIETADTIHVVNERGRIVAEDVINRENEYYSFGEHMEYFKRKFRAWRASFKTSINRPQI